MKYFGVLSIFLLSFHLYGLPLKYSFPKEKKKKKNLIMTEVEIVPSKVTEKRLRMKTMHGKVITRKVEVKPMDQSDQHKALAEKYFKEIEEHLRPLLKGIIGPVILKLQIQENGQFDVLQVKSKNLKTVKEMENKLYNLRALPPIPTSMELSEIQLIITFS